MKKKGYAAQTTVPASRTRAEIEELLRAEGAAQVLTGYDSVARKGLVAFTLESRQFRIPLVAQHSSDPKKRDQLERQHWRILLLLIKGKLEMVRAGVVTAQDEFMAYTVLPGGKTLTEHIQPELSQAYETGVMPKLLP